MYKHLLYLLFFFSLSAKAQRGAYPPDVQKVLAQAGKNRPELEKAIAYCKKTGDPLKLKAVYFLIANMDIHYGVDYYWADSKGKIVPYNENSYPNYDVALAAINKLRANVAGIHAVTVTQPDIEYIKGDFLINNINSAFRAWKNSPAKKIPFADFCEYILPYRISVEPLQDWRLKYQQRFNDFGEDLTAANFKTKLVGLADGSAWFSSTFKEGYVNEPLPRLGAMQILFRKRGLCEDMADLQVFILRSQGIPVALNVIPFWATATGSHFCNTVFNAAMQPLQYDAARPHHLLNLPLEREPSKVIQTTYSRQNGTLASFTDLKDIPKGFMQDQNYKDITDKYWETTTINCALSPDNKNHKIAYACVFNGTRWRPTWWGRVNSNTVTFSKMSKGVVYLPGYYDNNKIIAAGYPVAEGYHHEAVLKPDLTKKRTILLKQEAKYLVFKPGKKYRLFYWDNHWQVAGEQVAATNTNAMAFNNVPGNCLLLLLPEGSEKKERPFMITEDGSRNWF